MFCLKPNSETYYPKKNLLNKKDFLYHPDQLISHYYRR